MRIPPPVISALARSASGAHWQAFPLLSVDDDGHPHVCFLSRRQLRVAADSRALLASVASRGTLSNVRRRPQASVLVVDGEVVYQINAVVAETRVGHGRAALVLNVVSVKEDSAHVELVPLGFVATPELEADERWVLDDRMLDELESERAQRVT